MNVQEQIKVFLVEAEDNFTRVPTTSEGMKQCHSFSSEILYEVKNSLGNVVVDTDSEEDNEAETSKNLSFCMIILEATILIAERIFYHDSIYLYILEKNLIS